MTLNNVSPVNFKGFNVFNNNDDNKHKVNHFATAPQNQENDSFELSQKSIGAKDADAMDIDEIPNKNKQNNLAPLDINSLNPKEKLAIGLLANISQKQDATLNMLGQILSNKKEDEETKKIQERPIPQGMYV